MEPSKLEIFQRRAYELAEEEISQHVRGLGNEQMEKLAEAIIASSANVSARLLAEYDANKEKGNI